MTLEEAIEIAQNQDATAHKVGNIRPEFKGEPLQMEVHKLQGNRQSRASRKRQQPRRPASNDQKQGRSKRETCFYCGAKPSHPKSECPGKREKCFNCGKEGHYGSVFKSKSKDARVNELHVQSTTVSECVDCVLNEYEPVYFNAPTHHLNTVTVESLNHPKSEPHIRPLWFSQESSSQIFQNDCEVDTGASCNILPFYKAKALFGNDLKLDKPTVNLNGYNDSPVENLGSRIVYLYHGNKIFSYAVQAKTDRSIKTLVVVADALSRVSPQPTPKEGEDEEDFTPVHMLTEEIPADSTRVGDFRRATAEDTISGLPMQVIANGWPELKKD